MRILKILFLLIIMSTLCNGQDLRNIDSTLKSIDQNVSIIKDNFEKEKEEPVTGQSIFEDRKGNSSIFLPQGGIFRLNTADASLKLSYIDKVSNRPYFFGFNISGKTNNGMLPLITNGDIAPGAKINGVFGIQELFRTSDWLDGWIVLNVGYEGAAFKLFNPTDPFSQQIKKTSFNSFTSSLSFNLKIYGNKLLALSIGYEKANNYDDLTPIEITEQKIFADSLSNTNRSYENIIYARKGVYQEFDQIPINVDFFWTPNNNPRIGFYHYWRTKISDNQTINGFGSGLYLLKSHSLLTAIAGIVFEVKDISKLKDGFKDNFVVNFIVGYNFNL